MLRSPTAHVLIDSNHHNCNKIRNTLSQQALRWQECHLGAEGRVSSQTPCHSGMGWSQACRCPHRCWTEKETQDQVSLVSWSGCRGQAPLKTDPETRMWAQVFYLGGDSRGQKRGDREGVSWEGGANKKWIIELWATGPWCLWGPAELSLQGTRGWALIHEV